MPKGKTGDHSAKKSVKRKRVEDTGIPANRQIVVDDQVIDVPEVVEDIRVDQPFGEIERKITKKRVTKEKAKEVPRELDIRAQFPVFDNKMMHLATSKGDVANRVIVCSDEKVAWRFARYFDNPSEVIEVVSTRHFRTYTGLFQGVPVSVIASGMGGPMVDFTMREAKFCIGTDSPMAVVRFGTCCSISNAAVNEVVVATKGTFNVQTDFVDRQKKKERGGAYKITDLVESDENLSRYLKEHIRETLPKEEICKTGICGTTDSFYSSQARTSLQFHDDNENLLNEILKKYPKAKTLDMETYNILATAKMAKNHDIYASAVSLVVVNRMHPEQKE